MKKVNPTWAEVVKMFKNLPVSEQEAIQNFFNLHNAAIWIYNFLTEEAKAYVDKAISVSQFLDDENSEVIDEHSETTTITIGEKKS